VSGCGCLVAACGDGFADDDGESDENGRITLQHINYRAGKNHDLKKIEKIRFF